MLVLELICGHTENSLTLFGLTSSLFFVGLVYKTFVVRQKALAMKPCDKKIKGVLRQIARLAAICPKQSFGKREVLGEGKTFDLTKGCPSPKNT